MKELNCLQKVNHFSASWCIGRKDRLMRTINGMKRIHGKHYEIHPEGYILPGERDAFVRQVSNEAFQAVSKGGGGGSGKRPSSASNGRADGATGKQSAK